MIARLKGDTVVARAAFTKVRTKLEEELRIHPDNMDLLSDLGLIDAALGRKEEALSEGRRAMELRARALPTAQDPMFGSSTNEASLKTDRKSTRLNSSHRCISYAVVCLKKK